MEYVISAILLSLLIILLKIFWKSFFIEDNPKLKSEFEHQGLSSKSVESTFLPILNNFKLRPSLMNSNERVFFEQLKIAVGGFYDIYPQVQLGAIFQPVKQWDNWGELSRLNKRIDFVLYNKNTQTPKIAIELDGDSHSHPKSFNRDEFVGGLFQKFNIPLVRFNNGNYSVQDIKSKLSNLNLN